MDVIILVSGGVPDQSARQSWTEDFPFRRRTGKKLQYDYMLSTAVSKFKGGEIQAKPSRTVKNKNILQFGNRTAADLCKTN